MKLKPKNTIYTHKVPQETLERWFTGNKLAPNLHLVLL